MKKIALLGVCLMVCAGSESSVFAYSRTKEPISPTCAVVGTAAIGAGVWGLMKLIVADMSGVSMGAQTHGFLVALHTKFNPMSDKWSAIVATGVAITAGYLGWKGFSSYTAAGYARAAEDIMSGNKCSQPEVLELVQKSAGNAQVLADSVVSYFAAQKNEKVKAVAALEELFNQLSLANHYFDVAKKDSKCADIDLMIGYQEIIEAYLTVIRAASLVIKAYPDYQRQCDAETQELAVYAQFATANAIHAAGNASRVNYNYNIN